MHGGTRRVLHQRGTLWGLSPRARGNHTRSASPVRLSGSIPACTGEPAVRDMGVPRPKVYPRVHGGTSGRRSRRTSARGLSPRARGNRPVVFSPTFRLGSIPACTGEPFRSWRARCPGRVYPRVHGGNPAGLPRRCSHAGSIPACTGEPWSRSVARSAGEVYPRVHGGTAGLRVREIAQRGLSPRARGNPDGAWSSRPCSSSGLSPACTGEPQRPGPTSLITCPPVYPRVHGGTVC